MIPLNHISGLPRISKLGKKKTGWEKPKDSIGYKIGPIGKRFFCWEAIGPAREQFEKLGPQIKTYLENCANPVPVVVIFTLYMIGRSEETSAPILIFSCEDVTARKGVRKVIENSAIMSNYPGIKLGDSPVPFDLCNPKPLGIKDIELAESNWRLEGVPAPVSTLNCEDTTTRREVRDPVKQNTNSPDYPSINLGDSAASFDWDNPKLPRPKDKEYLPDTMGEFEVRFSPSQSAIGIRLFIRSLEEDSRFRPATGGGRVYINNKSYYLTVAHAFEKSIIVAIDDQVSYSLNDCDFEGKSDTEDDNGESSDTDNEYQEMTSKGSRTPEDGHMADDFSSDSSLPDDETDFSIQTASATHPIGSRLYSADLAAVNLNLESLSENPNLSRISHADLIALKTAGKVVLTSKTGSNPSRDYALIEESRENTHLCNEISLTTIQLTPKKVSRIESKDLDIVTATSSSGVLSGKLSATPSYIRLANSRAFQEVYTISLNGTVNDGDCGSWVIDSKTGDLYGHIVAGSPGTGMAYIVPATQIIADLEARLGVHVSLQSANPVSTSRLESRFRQVENSSKLRNSLSRFHPSSPILKALTSAKMKARRSANSPTLPTILGTVLRQHSIVHPQLSESLPIARTTMDPAPTFAAVLEQNSVIHTQLGEWLSNPNSGIHGRLATHYSLPGNPSTSNQSQYPQSISSPMARPYLHIPSTASAYTPSLLYSEATPTELSVSTGLASRFSGVPLLEEIDGVLERRPNYRQPVFECAFWFLSCSYISHDQEEWKTHCLSHFRGEEPPKSVQCPLCENFRATSENGGDAWNARMDHIASCHYMLGHTLRTSRPDFHLFQHLRTKRLIDDADLKELKGGNHNLARAPQPFVITNGRNRRGDQQSQRVGRGR